MVRLTVTVTVRGRGRGTGRGIVRVSFRCKMAFTLDALTGTRPPGVAG